MRCKFHNRFIITFARVLQEQQQQHDHVKQQRQRNVPFTSVWAKERQKIQWTPLNMYVFSMCV